MTHSHDTSTPAMSAETVPREEFVLVPREPTPEMVDAGRIHGWDDPEHVKPLALGGEHRESNMAPALAVIHREKTAEEAGIIAKVDRIRRKANGTWPKSKTPLRSRGFPKSRAFAESAHD